MRRDVFQAIADPVRRDILALISEEALTINEICEAFEISRPAISKHVKILNECGVINIENKGRERLCTIEADKLIPAYMWLDQYKKIWSKKLDSFETYLMKLKESRHE